MILPSPSSFHRGNLIHDKRLVRRLKKRRQLKQSISEKNANEQNPAHPLPKSPLISCPDAQNGTEPTDRAAKAGELQSRKGVKPPSDSGEGPP